MKKKIPLCKRRTLNPDGLKGDPERILIQVDSNKKQAKINNLITGSASRINNKSEHKERGFTYYYLQGTSPEQKKD